MDADLFLPKYLDMTTSLVRDIPAGFTYGNRDAFIKANGQNWPVAAKQDVPGPFHVWPKACFDNAYRLARRWPSRYRYVEGLAYGVIPTHHAWVINRDGEVLDPTWQAFSRLGAEYFGVVIPLAIAKQVRHKQCLSIIDNWHRRWPLYREPWADVLSRNAVMLVPRHA
jgi:hypothetical protein